MRNFRCSNSPCIDWKQRKYLKCYDEDVENRFAEEIEKYHKENNQELIVVLSTFDTGEKGGDGGFNPNDTYTNWQWHLVKTADKKSWDIINWGY